jgi:hypothetical protein
MKNADNKRALMDQLAQYGYALSVPGTPAAAPEKVLEALLKQEDTRLLEGFPVVLANALSQKSALEWEKNTRPGGAFSGKVRDRFGVLLGLSALLFELFGMKEHHKRAMKLLSRCFGTTEEKKLMDLLTGPFSRSENLDLESKGGSVELSNERLKNTFRNYVVHQAGSGKELEEQKNALEFELLLSSLFTARQKELLQKRLAGKPMTKTEREYYSRVVKKRLNALADPRLHQMACSLV